MTRSTRRVAVHLSSVAFLNRWASLGTHCGLSMFYAFFE